MGKEIKCENDYIESCNDKKNGYKGFTRKCEGVPLSKCHEVKLITDLTLKSFYLTRFPKNLAIQLTIQNVSWSQNKIAIK